VAPRRSVVVPMTAAAPRNTALAQRAGPRSDRLDQRDRLAIELFAEGLGATAVGRAVGLHRRSIERRAARPVFHAALAEAVAERNRALRRRLRAGAALAVDRLVAVVEDESLPPGVQLAAAGRLLDFWCRLEPAEARVDARVAVDLSPSRGRPGDLWAELDRMAERLHWDSPRVIDVPARGNGHEPDGAGSGDRHEEVA
jgi:hypothetical protein